MTESGLLSQKLFKAMAAENFVCVRLFTTVLGGGKDQVQKFLPGLSDTLRDSLMYQGNSLIVMLPDGRIVTNKFEVVEQSPDLLGDEIQFTEKLPGALLELHEVMKRFPAKGRPIFSIPWQFSPAHAFVVSWDDNRRIIVVNTSDDGIDKNLQRVLNQPDFLKRFYSRFVFVKVGPEHPVPPKIREALNEAGPGGLLILEIPETNKGCLSRDTEQHYRGPWPPILAISPSSKRVGEFSELLEEYRVDLPTYISRREEMRRRQGRGNRTGFESFQEIWKKAPAKVKRQWSEEQIGGIQRYEEKVTSE